VKNCLLFPSPTLKPSTSAYSAIAHRRNVNTACAGVKVATFTAVRSAVRPIHAAVVFQRTSTNFTLHHRNQCGHVSVRVSQLHKYYIRVQLANAFFCSFVSRSLCSAILQWSGTVKIL
jgi:hypothetical protein